MRQPEYPRLTVRLPRAVIEALKQAAQEQGRTPSDILRALAIDAMKAGGYLIDDKEEESIA